ncbi:hypothetical protein EVAR_14875_1 [Eumeta japonica]|uniref:Uncharacterized protein n=1 Tax=Eumeta variegata TaxID=151549 RepID=A0A4C1V5A9_EUMVA|nr:hypothetical protein EVAR_14875_1 [Eumeta japonica]
MTAVRVKGITVRQYNVLPCLHVCEQNGKNVFQARACSKISDGIYGSRSDDVRDSVIAHERALSRPVTG